jgi:hypothetical protein
MDEPNREKAALDLAQMRHPVTASNTLSAWIYYQPCFSFSSFLWIEVPGKKQKVCTKKERAFVGAVHCKKGTHMHSPIFLPSASQRSCRRRPRKTYLTLSVSDQYANSARKVKPGKSSRHFFHSDPPQILSPRLPESSGGSKCKPL